MCASRTHNLTITAHCIVGMLEVNQDRIDSLNGKVIYNDDILPCTTLNWNMWINRTIWILKWTPNRTAECVVFALIRAAV